MLHSIQYSIKEHLKSLPFTAVVWAYNGVDLSDKVLPFATVEHVNSGVRTLDKRATHTGTAYNFQVGVFCTSANQLAKLQEQTRKHLTGDIPLYNTAGDTPFLTTTFIRGGVLNVVPMPVEGVEDITRYHRCYIDVQVNEIEQL